MIRHGGLAGGLERAGDVALVGQRLLAGSVGQLRLAGSVGSAVDA